jgi:monomeric isocitrate dehydrogenase
MIFFERKDKKRYLSVTLSLSKGDIIDSPVMVRQAHHDITTISPAKSYELFSHHP